MSVAQRSAVIPVLILLASSLVGCRSAPPVPVVDRQTGSASKVDTSGPVYVVKKGDTLYSIALDNGLYYRDVQAWNSLENPNIIQAGQSLRLSPPGDRPAGAKTSPVTVPPTVQAQPVVEQKPLGPAQPPKAEVKPTQPPVTATTAAAAEAMPGWAWPAKGKVVGAFGDGAGGKGIDIAGNPGDPVMAVGEGKVVYVGSGLRGYGQMVIVKHENNYLTAYAHNRKLLVTEGQNVRQGQKIAEMGDSDADRVKLHFEVRKQGKPVDPALYLPKK